MPWDTRNTDVLEPGDQLEIRFDQPQRGADLWVTGLYRGVDHGCILLDCSRVDNNGLGSRLTRKAIPVDWIVEAHIFDHPARERNHVPTAQRNNGSTRLL